MAVCTICGAIMHEEDIEKHVCKNIPPKGTEHKVKYDASPVSVV